MEKISDTQYKKIVSQPDVEIISSLDQLLADKESLMQGISNNREAIIFQSAKLDEIDLEIEQVKNLGIKSSVEIAVEVQAKLEEAKIETEPIVETPVDSLPVEKLQEIITP